MSHPITNFHPRLIFLVSFVEFPWGWRLNDQRESGCFGKHFLVIDHIFLSHINCQCEFTMVQRAHGMQEEVVCIWGGTCWESHAEDFSFEGHGAKLQFLRLSLCYSQIYWSLGNFLQMISLSRFIGCLKPGLGDSGKTYLKIWSSTNLCFVILYLDSTQGYQMWHQGAASLVRQYMLFGLLIPRRNCWVYWWGCYCQCFPLCIHLYASIEGSSILQYAGSLLQSDFSKIKRLWFQFLLFSLWFKGKWQK